MTAPELQQEIERTRQRLGRTLEELAAKADFKARAKEMAAEARGKALEARDKARERAVEVSGQLQRRWPFVAVAAGVLIMGGSVAARQWQRPASGKGTSRPPASRRRT